MPARGSLSIFFGGDRGAIAEASRVRAIAAPSAILVADFTDDGLDDLVVASFERDAVLVLANRRQSFVGRFYQLEGDANPSAIDRAVGAQQELADHVHQLEARERRLERLAFHVGVGPRRIAGGVEPAMVLQVQGPEDLEGPVAQHQAVDHCLPDPSGPPRRPDVVLELLSE